MPHLQPRTRPQPCWAIGIRVVLLVLLTVATLSGCAPSAPPDSGASTASGDGQEERPGDALQLHHLQFLGSHNSYKEAIDASLFELFAAENPTAAASLEYRHPSLTAQLDHGLRKLELDVFHDPEGGRYATPSGIERVAAANLQAGPAYDPNGAMAAPGFKVLHVQDLDFRSNCLTLQLCLQELRAWSEAHPEHLPVVVTVNAKDQAIDGLTPPLRFDGSAFDALDQEVLAGLGKERLLVPDDVRGTAGTLEGAITMNGWPQLAEVRGKFLWILDEGGEKLETYVAGHPSLEGRVFFVNAEPGRPEAAFRIVNDPIGRAEEIRALVQRGYLVRTRADADTKEARGADISRRQTAFSSGAHYVSTDYAFGNPFGTEYSVALPGGGVARCNPISAPADCRPPEERITRTASD